MRLNINNSSINPYDSLFPDRFLLRTGNQYKLDPVKRKKVDVDVIASCLTHGVYSEYIEFLLMSEHGITVPDAIRKNWNLKLSIPSFRNTIDSLLLESVSYMNGDVLFIDDIHTKDEDYLSLKIKEMKPGDRLVLQSVDMLMDIPSSMYEYGIELTEEMSPFWLMTRSLAYLRGEKNGNWYLSIYEWNKLITDKGLTLIKFHQINDTERHFILIFIKPTDGLIQGREHVLPRYSGPPVDGFTLNIRNSLITSVKIAFETDDKYFNQYQSLVTGKYIRGYPRDAQSLIIDDWSLINPALSRGMKVTFLGPIKKYYNFNLQRIGNVTIITSDKPKLSLSVEYDPCDLKKQYPWINPFDPFSNKYTLRYSQFKEFDIDKVYKHLLKGSVKIETDNIDALVKDPKHFMNRILREKNHDKVPHAPLNRSRKDLIYDFFVKAIDITDTSVKTKQSTTVYITNIDKYRKTYKGSNYESDVLELWKRYRILNHPSPFSDEFKHGLFREDEIFGIEMYNPEERVIEDGFIPSYPLKVVSDIYLPGYHARQGNVYVFKNQ